MARYRTLLLDLDGTLVDAFTTIHRGYVHTLPRFGRPAPTMEEVRRAVGGGLENAMRKFLPEELVPAAVQIHLAHTESISTGRRTPPARRSRSGPYPTRTRRATGGFTNKRGEHGRRLCDHLGVTPYLSGHFGAKDTPWLKPQPEFSAHALTQLGAHAATTLLLGDSPYDVQAARHGGFDCWCVTTGTHDTAQLTAAGAARVFPDLLTLAAALD
jgi:phosphoglycolate phosphatase